jgi:hypothetical protein
MQSCIRFVLATLPAVLITLACSDENATTPDDGSHASSDSESAHETESATPAKSDAPAKADAPKGVDAIPEAMRPATMVDDLKEKLLVPNLANKGVAVFTDVMTIQPGADITFCTYTPVVTDELMYMHATYGVQSRFGHHAVMQFVKEPHEPTTHECSPTSLEAQSGGGILGGSGKEGTNVGLPGNVVSEVPAGAQLVINHHWINTSEEPVDVQAEMITVPVEVGTKDMIIARPFLIQNTDFNIAAHETGEFAVQCDIDHDVSLISSLGHEHEWGTHVKAERLGDSPDVLFDHSFDESLVLHPMVNFYPVQTPYQFKAGDQLKLTCQWNNTTNEALSFPHEMCVFSAWQIGADHDAICSSGEWMK